MPEACSYRMLISLHPPCRTLAIHACAHAPHWRSLNMHLRLVCDAMRCLAFPPAHSLAHYAPPAHNLLCDPPPLPACPSAPRRYMRQRLMCDAPPSAHLAGTCASGWCARQRGHATWADSRASSTQVSRMTSWMRCERKLEAWGFDRGGASLTSSLRSMTSWTGWATIRVCSCILSGAALHPAALPSPRTAPNWCRCCPSVDAPTLNIHPP